MITAHPLAWPAGWPRTTGGRKRADFGRQSREGQWSHRKRLEVIDGVDRVLRELEALRVDRQDVVVSTNIRTRLDGLPRSGEAEPRDPGVAVYWVTYEKPKTSGAGGVNPPLIERRRVMAIDRYDRVADNLAAIAATLDALRAIARHGGGQILDRAFAGFAALPAPGEISQPGWRDVLDVPAGLPVQVQRERFEQHYRSMRKAAHPDHGGTGTDFDRVQKAYEQGRAELGL